MNKNNVFNLREKKYNNFQTLQKSYINHLVFYPAPVNLNYIWSFGSLAGIFFFLQILSGVFLAMHYVAHIELAFNFVEHIMRDVNYGWLFRYMHANGASFVFIFLYAHIGKGLYFRSYAYPRGLLWVSGILIFLLMMGTAFVGYVLPWGQMSFWGATAITNLITAVPYIGEPIAFWLWGGFSVGHPTLNRFFSIHYLLPFLILGIILIHLTLLHEKGSSNPMGAPMPRALITFVPYFSIKDFFALFLTLCIYIIILSFYPNVLGHSDNYIPSNSLVTPTHIVPEWYFLPFYAILRAVPNKLGGVVAMLIAILIFIILPIIAFQIDKRIKSTRFSKIRKNIFWGLVFTFIFLGFIGGSPAEDPFIYAGRSASIMYFILVTLLGLI